MAHSPGIRGRATHEELCGGLRGCVSGVLSLLTICLASAVSVGATRSVAPDGSGDYPTIQAAIDASSSGDIVSLLPGTFTGSGNIGIDLQGKNVIVQSSSGDPLDCTIDCNDVDVGFYIRSGESRDAVVRGITISRGRTAQAGGMHVLGSSPTIEHCRFVDNVCASGIGGGGILWEQSAGIIKDCHFERNYSALGAGAIHMYRMDGSEVERCTFIANVTRSAPFGSSGAIQASTGSVTIRDSVFADNDADAGAGALLVDDGHAIVQLCTFVRNKGFFCISAWHESIQVENCIVAFNQGASFECPTDASLSCNDVFGNADGDWLECIVNDLGLNGNVSADPLFCDVAGSDWRLSSESPCAPEHSGGCGLIGALVEGCGPDPIVDSSWGTIKLRFVEPE